MQQPKIDKAVKMTKKRQNAQNFPMHLTLTKRLEIVKNFSNSRSYQNGVKPSNQFKAIQICHRDQKRQNVGSAMPQNVSIFFLMKSIHSPLYNKLVLLLIPSGYHQIIFRADEPEELLKPINLPGFVYVCYRLNLQIPRKYIILTPNPRILRLLRLALFSSLPTSMPFPATRLSSAAFSPHFSFGCNT